MGNPPTKCALLSWPTAMSGGAGSAADGIGQAGPWPLSSEEQGSTWLVKDQGFKFLPLKKWSTIGKQWRWFCLSLRSGIKYLQRNQPRITKIKLKHNQQWNLRTQLQPGLATLEDGRWGKRPDRQNPFSFLDFHLAKYHARTSKKRVPGLFQTFQYHFRMGRETQNCGFLLFTRFCREIFMLRFTHFFRQILMG